MYLLDGINQKKWDVMISMFNFFTRITIRFLIVLFCFAGLIVFLYASKLGGSKQKSIAVLAWQNQLDKQFLLAFEQETGIHVHISYIDNNEDIVSKLSLTPDHGYDLVMPSDYYVPLLINMNLIKKIDKTRLPFWPDLYPALLDHKFDPYNEYSIPYFWGIIGLGINVDYFDGELPEATWGLLFDERLAPNHIAVLDDMYVLISIAAHYLYGESKIVDETQIKEVKELLIKQKEWVIAYTDLRIEYLLESKACPVVMAMNADIVKIMRRNKNIQFLVPKEGGFISMDLFCIAQTSEKEDMVYEFLNYLYKPSILQQYVDKFEFFSPIKTVVVKHENKNMDKELGVPTEMLFKTVQFFSYYELPTSVFHDIWISLKA